VNIDKNSLIVVTGAAGFIGSCVVAKLNEEGFANLIIVDHIGNSEKRRNLEKKRYKEYYDKTEFLEVLEADQLPEKVGAVIHMGACSSTTLTDAEYYETNNFQYTQKLARWSLDRGIRFIYASSAATYGVGEAGYKDDVETIRRCRPLNLYGSSKQKFDLYALDHGWCDKMVGLKFFNVFGPNEYHKGEMRSVVAKSYKRVVEEGRISLFKSHVEDYADGEQKRDFVYVKDVVEVILFFLEHPEKNGIFNVGTGRAESWNDLARALFKAVNKPVRIDYVEMPEQLRGKYQYFTQAAIDKLVAAGYRRPFTALDDAVRDYAGYLKAQSRW
jgi:ADP-L-glycero-D-manno-heptose 6-epimerase